MEQTIQNQIDQWLNGNYDEATKSEIRRLMRENPEELRDAFYKDLEFGTGGLRGIMGVGCNRMNRYTVANATQGLANFLKMNFPNEPIKVVVAYDSRNNSRQFADITADVLSANGIFCYLFDSLRPTPELSFAVRHLHCHSGVVITASHNPKEYNGYKAYWQDGGQLVPPYDHQVIDEVMKVTQSREIKLTRNPELVKFINKEVDTPYLERIAALSLNPQAIQHAKNFKIVYTPLHGTGITMVPKALEMYGFKNVHIVAEQSTPDGNFPTVVSPNPEEKTALTIALQQAEELGADLILATDPDADRVAIAARNNHGKMELLNGNMTGSLLMHYLLSQWKAHNKLTGKEFMVKTIVTTELIKDMATHYDVECYDVLTGFKYIAEKIKELEGKKLFIGGGEESCGYLVGDFVRDKDSVSSCCMIAEMAATCYNKGKTLFDLLADIYRQYGFYKEDLLSITKKGISGKEEINAMMEKFRTNPPKEINGSPVIKINDFKLRKAHDLLKGSESALTLPVSDVLQFFTADGSKITVRPSGTEPRIKFYFGVKEAFGANDDFEQTSEQLSAKIQNIIHAMGLK
ncbi:MAG: phospho-sugar mutase [Bacteroidales bacterium]|nr:phospho-sugar mutase [Bacteroidales bacterium]